MDIARRPMARCGAAQALAHSFDQHLFPLSITRGELIAGSTVETHRFAEMESLL
jgi:hypothetical protein